MNIFQNLNPEQKKAITFDGGPLLIVAGAGTGKTTVITQRLAWLILEKKIGTDNILALTFTDKAAGEMEERVDVLMPYGYVDLWVSTFHAFCERILKDNALAIGLPPDFKLFNQVEQSLLIRRNFEKFNLNYYKPLGNPTKFIQALVKHFSRAKDEDVMPADYLEYAKNLKLDRDQEEFLKKKEGEEISEQQRILEVADAYHTYQQLLLDNSALDFGDLIIYTIKLFKERPKILEKYQKQFQYILVDEFQDTNYAQYELIKILSAPKYNLTVVLDDDQSIYKFRGAAVSNVLEFKKDFPKSEEIILTKNYRSKQNILDLAYKFIQLNNPNRLEYQLSRDKIGPKGAPLKSKVCKRLKAVNKGQGLVEHLHFKSHIEEAYGVVDKIIELKKRGKKLSWSDFAILVRANSYANGFIIALARHDIPYQFLASSGLYTQPEVMDVIAYLKMLDNYHESASLWRVLNFSHWNLPASELMGLSKFAYRKNASIFEVLKIARTLPGFSQKMLEAIDKITSMIESHSALTKTKTVGQVALKFMEDSGYLKSITNKDSPENLEKVMHLNQFFKKIEEFETSNDDKSVANFLHDFNLAQEAGEEGALSPLWEEGPDAVKIMTVHGAKGLEFTNVFLVSLVDKRFPSVERPEPIELPDDLIKEIIPEGDIHLQEERRLFYVGMTRAKNGLFFTSADDYGGTRKKKFSRFLVESGFERKKGTEELDGLRRLKPPVIKKEEVDHLNFLQKSIPEKSSFTQIRAFQTCPKQFKYAHIYKIPVEGRFTFSFGKTVHNTLYQFFKLIKERSSQVQTDLFGTKSKKKVKPQVSLNDLMDIYKQEWIPDWYLSKNHEQEYKEKGRAFLKEFFQSHHNDFPIPLYLEQMFNVKLGEYVLKGVIDRIDVVGASHIARRKSKVTISEEVEIIDYKTGRVPKSDKMEEDDRQQLFIYDLAARDVFHLQPVKLTYYFIEANKKISFPSEPEKLAKFKEEQVKIIKSMRASDFKATPGYWCNTCDFKEICEDRWRG